MSTREGGLAAWSPRVLPGIAGELTPAQELAVALRHLDDIGWCENLTGHITVQVGDRLLCNPWGLWWAETTATDILTLDLDGSVVDGELDVTPAIHIHTELHRRRPDATVVIHNHPPYAAALAAIGELPDIVHQNSSILADDMVLVRDYDGEVDAPFRGAELAERIGNAAVALLVSHGVIVTAPSIAQGVYTAALFERTCHLHWLVATMGRSAVPIAERHQLQLKASLIERAAPVYWGGAVRQLLRNEPEVLGSEVRR